MLDSHWFNESIVRLRRHYGPRRPRRRLGQNFLIDWNLLRAILEDAALETEDVVLEVGTGPGLLTALLAERVAHVVTVDKDRSLLGFARATVADFKEVTLLEGDVLLGKRQISPDLIHAFRNRLSSRPGLRARFVANLPYSVATPVILGVLRELPEIGAMVVMTQKELGERLAADPSQRAYGPPRVRVALVAEVEVLRSVPPSVFWPRPKVDSVILRIRRRTTPLSEPSSSERFDAFLARVFGQRRKTLRAVLAPVFAKARAGFGWTDLPDPLPTWSSLRAENLNPSELVRLFEAVNPLLP